MSKPISLELLAPARDADTALAAIDAGADAVYIGASAFGARHAAGNSLDDLRRVVEYARPFGVRVYATVNTIVYDDEIDRVEALISDLYRIGVDALIVQDMGVLRMDIPPIELHASTQTDIRDAAKARFLAEVGMSRLVLARELSLDEIAEIHRQLPGMELEAFVHGALCVSYSGDCRASYMACGRSANRGECAQICRLPFEITDTKGRKLLPAAHYLSLRDLNRSASIADMAAAGVTSFKIEGRLKDKAYVVNTVTAYSEILDSIVSASGGRYVRSSAGHTKAGFTPSLDKSFNRGYTPYFLTGRAPAGGMASFSTPKAVGVKVAEVTKCADGKWLKVKASQPLANGDGLSYIDAAGRLAGFRVNRVDGATIYPATPVRIVPGTVLYRNRDKQWDDTVASARPVRTIGIDLRLSAVRHGDTWRLILCLTDETGVSVAVASEPTELQPAVTPQSAARRKILTKLGATRYEARQLDDAVGDLFVPASLLTALRRRATDLLDRTRCIRHRYGYRKAEDIAAPLPHGGQLTYRDNVANHLAQQFYTDHGADTVQPAVEVQTSDSETLVMNTRYCLRRELGRCLRTPQGRTWPSPGQPDLILTNPTITMRATFDCTTCRMMLYTKPKK